MQNQNKSVTQNQNSDLQTLVFCACALSFSLLSSKKHMLRLHSLQQQQRNKVKLYSLIKSRPSLQTRLISTKKIVTTATCTTIPRQQQQNTKYFSTLWRTAALVSATTLAYGLTSKVFALEANDCKLTIRLFFFSILIFTQIIALGDTLCQAIVQNDMKTLKK